MPEKDMEEIDTNIKINKETQLNLNDKSLDENNNLEEISPLKAILSKTKINIKKPEKFDCFKKTRTILYLSFHNFIIVIIILISMMVSGLISATYFIFSLVFLMESSNLILGTYFSYPKKIKKTIRILILCDILIQLVIQNPISGELRKTKIFKKIERIIGLSEIIKYEEKNVLINQEGLVLIFGKVITLFLINLQVLMFSSQDFQEFYLSYLITKKDRIKRTQMMNVYIFNNKRIEKMNENLERRVRMEKSMNSLEKTLEEWNQKLAHINDEKPINLLDSKKKEDDNISVMTGGSLVVDENIVREEIKNYILSGFLVKILLFLHKHSSSYNSIEKDRRIYYERDMIQGKTFTKLYLEELIDNELNSIDMSCYKKKEIKIIKKILSGERKRKDEENENENLEEEKEVNLDKLIGKYDEDYEIDNIKKKKRKELKKEDDKKNNKKKEKKEKEIKIDFSLEKFKRIDDLREGEIYKKYLKKTTLIIAILKNLLHFSQLNFHYLCYLMMIINHMISSSFLTLIYPISVFCFAFNQYPRPSKNFWNFCLYTSVFIIVIKFIIQLDIQLDFILDDLFKYRIGLIKFESTFSKDFFEYIVCDSLVIIFISIEIYILINQGLWLENMKLMKELLKVKILF